MAYTSINNPISSQNTAFLRIKRARMIPSTIGHHKPPQNASQRIAQANITTDAPMWKLRVNPSLNAGDAGVNTYAVIIVSLSWFASIASTEETIDRQSVAVCA